MTLLEPLGSAERATGAAVVTLAGPDQAKVVPGRVEAGVFVDGALEFALGVVRKSLGDEKLPELVVNVRGAGVLPQHVEMPLNPRVELAASVQVARVIRCLIGIVVFHRRA